MPVRVDPSGVTGPTPRQARGSRWRRSSRGYHVPVDVPLTPEQRIVEAATVLPSYGGVTGWAALRWRGAHWFDGLAAGGRLEQPVQLAVGPGNVRHQPGIRICKEGIGPTDLTVVDGLRVTTAVRSVCWAMRHAASVRQAVVVFDMAAFNDLVSIDEMRQYLTRALPWTGIPKCRDAMLLASENAWSPAEVGMRGVWVVDAGLPEPLCNVPVFDRRGRLVGTPDLFDPEAGLVGEYDGSLHLDPARRARDIVREEGFRRLGLECVTMTAADQLDPSRFVARLHAVRRRSLFLPEDRRPWTIEPPPGWLPTLTVAQRRSLTPAQRRRLLRHRQP